MPIVRISNRLVYYCHVPKAAGTALEAYLAAQFGPLAFADEAFYTVEEPDRWTRSSPQHLDVRSLGRLFPDAFFDSVFAVVRHPVPRLVSAYKFQKLVEGLIPADTHFDEWVQGLSKDAVERRCVLDNHLLPMSLLVPEGARVFRLEDGMAAVIDYLQDLAGPEVTLPRAVEPVNVLSVRLEWMGVADEAVAISEESHRHIADLYREDFERFGYASEAKRPEPPTVDGPPDEAGSAIALADPSGAAAGSEARGTASESFSEGPSSASEPLTIHAVHPNWRSDLILDAQNSRLTHARGGARGRYTIDDARLIVEWDEYPVETFFKFGNLFVHEHFDVFSVLIDENSVKGIIGHQKFDIARISIVVPDTNRSVTMRPGTSDVDVFRQIFLNRAYESPYFPKDIRTIVDLGANVGMASVFFAMKYPSARIACVEPGVENFELLLENTKNCESVVARIHGAGWPSDGTVNLLSKDPSGADLGAWGLRVSAERAGDSSVKSYNLATLFDEAGFAEVDLLKIDIEGAELDIFTTGFDAWLDRTKFICVETHDRFREGSEAAVRQALLSDFEELPMSGENLLFVRRASRF